MTMTNEIDQLAIQAIKTFLRRHSAWDPHGMTSAVILLELWEHYADNCRDCVPVVIDMAGEVAMALPDSVFLPDSFYEDPFLFANACARWERLACVELIREGPIPPKGGTPSWGSLSVSSSDSSVN